MRLSLFLFTILIFESSIAKNEEKFQWMGVNFCHTSVGEVIELFPEAKYFADFELLAVTESGETLGARYDELFFYILSDGIVFGLIVVIDSGKIEEIERELDLLATRRWKDNVYKEVNERTVTWLRLAEAGSDIHMHLLTDETNEKYLMMIAHHGTAHHVEKLISKYRTCKRLQDAQNANQQHALRKLSYYYDDTGSLIINGRFPPEQGAMILKALDMAIEQADTYARKAEKAAKDKSLKSGQGDENTSDAKVTAVTQPRESVTVRRALRSRDQGCRFPGCTHTQLIDGHHIQHWADGGDTSMGNLLQLCRHHHRLVHEGSFGCERLPNGQVLFTDQRGDKLAQTPVPISVVDEDAIDTWMHSIATEFNIDDRTCVPHWYAGDTMDWDLAAEHLFA